MTQPLAERDYQMHARLNLWEQMHQRPKENPLVVLPTGTGKSLCMANLIYSLLTAYPHVRIMNVTHVKELIESNYKTMLRQWPSCPAGIYSSGLNRKDIHSKVTFAGIQSVAKRAATFGHIDFLIIDEAHRISDSQNTYYARFIKDLKSKNPNMMVIGYTATDYRMKTGRLTEMELFDYVAFDGSSGEAFLWFIENGYLIKLVPKDPGFELDSSTVAINAGEFNIMEASAAMRSQDLLEKAVDTTIQYAAAQGRQCNLTFCQTIDDCELVADMFTHKGYPVRAVHSQAANRDAVLEQFRRGEIWGVTNQNILTTGFDNPRIDIITMLRLTRSPGLWVQMLGRGTRPCFAPGYDITTLEGRRAAIAASHKQTCLVLDFVGNTRRLGPINNPNVPDKRKPGGASREMARCCPECGTFNHISVKRCEECGYEFPPPDRLEGDASTDDLVIDLNNLKQPEPPPNEYEIMEVEQMVTSFHKAKDPEKPNTMRVTYKSPRGREVSEWVCIEHPDGSFPRGAAERWWKDHGGGYQCPRSLNDALYASKNLRKPMFLRYISNRKFPDIVAKDFDCTSTWLPDEILEDERTWEEVLDDEIPF